MSSDSIRIVKNLQHVIVDIFSVKIAFGPPVWVLFDLRQKFLKEISVFRFRLIWESVFKMFFFQFLNEKNASSKKLASNEFCFNFPFLFVIWNGIWQIIRSFSFTYFKHIVHAGFPPQRADGPPKMQAQLHVRLKIPQSFTPWVKFVCRVRWSFHIWK